MSRYKDRRDRARAQAAKDSVRYGKKIKEKVSQVAEAIHSPTKNPPAKIPTVKCQSCGARWTEAQIRDAMSGQPVPPGVTGLRVCPACNSHISLGIDHLVITGVAAFGLNLLANLAVNPKQSVTSAMFQPNPMILGAFQPILEGMIEKIREQHGGSPGGSAEDSVDQTEVVEAKVINVKVVDNVKDPGDSSK